MGGQAEYIFLDLVRATNDSAELGFMAEGRRLNVLLSRQEQALVIVGDKDCIKPLLTGSEKEDRKELSNRNYDNRQVIKIFGWLTKNGRLVEIPLDSVSQDYVKLHPISRKAVEFETGVTSSDASGDTSDGGWGVVAASGDAGTSGESGWGVVAASGDTGLVRTLGVLSWTLAEVGLDFVVDSRSKVEEPFLSMIASSDYIQKALAQIAVKSAEMACTTCCPRATLEYLICTYALLSESKCRFVV